MKLRKFNKNENRNLKKKIIIGIYAFLIIGIILTGASYAVYQQEAEVTFINARVGNFKQNDIELAIKLDGEEVEIPPEKNSLYTVTVDCDNATGLWISDNDKWGAYIDNINANKVKCEVNFTTPAPTLSDVTATSEKTSISLNYTASGINVNTTCKYGTDTNYGSTVEGVTNTTCNITGLETDVTYFYQICAVNSRGEVCKEGSIKTKKFIADFVEIGDYIKMTPTSTSYTISKDLTGYTSDQTINPSELNLWIIVETNDDGSIVVTSKYVSSEEIFFRGRTGYRNSVGALNTIASQYTNTKYVVEARHFGYRGECEVCEGYNNQMNDDYKIDARWFGNKCDGKMATDYKGTTHKYWIAARTGTGGYCNSYKIRRAEYDGSCGYNDGGILYRSKNGTDGYCSSYGDDESSASIRPVLTIKKDAVIISGDGKSAETAYQLS